MIKGRVSAGEYLASPDGQGARNSRPVSREIPIGSAWKVPLSASAIALS